jgi:hypothetical protein
MIILSDYRPFRTDTMELASRDIDANHTHVLHVSVTHGEGSHGSEVASV